MVYLSGYSKQSIDKLAKAMETTADEIKAILDIDKQSMKERIESVKTDLEAFELHRTLTQAEIDRFNVILRLKPVITKSAMDLKTSQEIFGQYFACPDDQWRSIYDDEIDRRLLIEAESTEDLALLKSMLKKCPKDGTCKVRNCQEFLEFKIGDIVDSKAPGIKTIGYGLDLWLSSQTEQQRDKVEHHIDNISDDIIITLTLNSTIRLLKRIEGKEFKNYFKCLRKRLTKHALGIFRITDKDDDDFGISAAQTQALTAKDQQSYLNIAERCTNPSKICILLSEIKTWLNNHKNHHKT